MLFTALLLLFVSNALASPWYIHFYARYAAPHSHHETLTFYSSMAVSEHEALSVLDNMADWSAGRFTATRVPHRPAVQVNSNSVALSRTSAMVFNGEMRKLVRERLGHANFGGSGSTSEAGRD